MAYMSYCRWEGTSKNMRDCHNALAEVEDMVEWFNNLDEHEQRGVRLLIQLSHFFVEELEPELPRE